MAIRWNVLGQAAAMSAVAFAISVFFFCPRLVMWRGLGIPLAHQTAECSRATYVLQQVVDPFVKIEDQTNQIIRWRLLVPMLGHYLHLPTAVILSIPYIGSLVALGYIARLLLDHNASLAVAFAGTLVSATSTWFFVSTGWLTYADSWLIFGLILIAFSPSRAALAATCLLVPWLDERIVIAAPVACATRIIYFRTFFDVETKSLLIDFAIVAGLLIPYSGFRAYLLATHDESSTKYFEHHPQDMNSNIPLWRFLQGAWMGVRAGWIFVGVLLWLGVSKVRPWSSAILIGSLIVTMAVGLTIAADIGRSSSTIAPAVVGGLLLLLRYRPDLLKYALPAAVAINLFTPAAHIVTVGTIPIRYAYAEIDRLSEPPPIVNPVYYLNQGVTYANAGMVNESLQCFDALLGLDERNVNGRIQRALLNAKLNNLPAALTDADLAVKYDPENPNVRLVRGSILLQQNQPERAAQDFTRALETADPHWPNRAECERLLAQSRSPKKAGDPFRL